MGYVGSSVTSIASDLVELQVVNTQLALTHTRDATVASVRAAPQRAGAAIQAIPTKLGDAAGEWMASRQAAAAAAATAQAAQQAAQQAAAMRAQQAEEEASARVVAAQVAAQEKEAAAAARVQRFRSLPRTVVGKAKAAVLVPPLLAVEAALDSVVQAGRAGADAQAEEVDALEIFTLESRQDGWDDVRDSVRGMISQREPAYRQLQDYAQPATSLLAAAAAEDGRELLKAKAKAVVLLPPLELTANALEVVSDVGAATVAAAEAAAVAAEAGAAAAAAGADSITDYLGPITDYPVLTMQPREDGWNDARELIKEREPAWHELVNYLQPRWEATSRASKLAARWAVVITEEVVLPLLGPLGVWLRTVPQRLQDAASDVGQRLQGVGPGGRNSVAATKRKPEDPGFSRRFAEWRRGVVASAGNEPTRRRFAWARA